MSQDLTVVFPKECGKGAMGRHHPFDVEVFLAQLVDDFHPLFGVHDDEVDGQLLEHRLVVLEVLVELALAVAGVLQGIHLRVGQLQQVHLVDMADLVGHQDLAVLHDAHPVGEVVDVLDTVRDEEDGHAVRSHCVKHADHLGQVEGGELFEGFVQDQELRPLLQCGQDRDEHAVGQVEVPDHGGRVQAEVVEVQE